MWPVLALALVSTPTPPPDLALVGVVRAPPPGRSVAVIEAGGRSRLAGVGDTVFGGRVEAIEADRVRLAFGEERIELPLSGADAAKAREQPSASVAGGPVFDRAQLQQRLATEAARILAETTLVPVSDETGIAGFALTRLPGGTVLSEAGIRAGDVLVRINGVKVDSMATLAGLWTRLQGAGSVEADLIRNGQPVSLRITLR